MGWITWKLNKIFAKQLNKTTKNKKTEVKPDFWDETFVEQTESDKEHNFYHNAACNILESDFVRIVKEDDYKYRIKLWYFGHDYDEKEVDDNGINIGDVEIIEIEKTDRMRGRFECGPHKFKDYYDNMGIRHERYKMTLWLPIGYIENTNYVSKDWKIKRLNDTNNPISYNS